MTPVQVRGTTVWSQCCRAAPTWSTFLVEVYGRINEESAKYCASRLTSLTNWSIKGNLHQNEAEWAHLQNFRGDQGSHSEDLQGQTAGCNEFNAHFGAACFLIKGILVNFMVTRSGRQGNKNEYVLI